MNRPIWIPTLLLFLLVFLLTSCDDRKLASWTILVYMAADNSLNEAAIDDINEMENASFSEDMNIILQIDSREGNLYNFYPGARRYRIYPESQPDDQNISAPVISSLGEIDSGDYNSLADFANWGFNQFPAEKNALVIWSHGNGWYDSYNRFCPDNESNSSISIPEHDLANGLISIYHDLDLLLIDACNMQCLEVLSEIYPYVEFVIGSENAVCADGFPYSDLFSSWESYPLITDLCEQIADLYINSYLPGGSQYQPGVNPALTVSAVKTEYFPELLDVLEQFCTNWSQSGLEPYFGQARNNCVEFNDLDSDVDLKEFFALLQDEDIPGDLDELSIEFETVLDQVFFAQKSYNFESDNLGTASIWFPDEVNVYGDLADFYEPIALNETGWNQFLIGFLNIRNEQ